MRPAGLLARDALPSLNRPLPEEAAVHDALFRGSFTGQMFISFVALLGGSIISNTGTAKTAPSAASPLVTSRSPSCAPTRLRASTRPTVS